MSRGRFDWLNALACCALCLATLASLTLSSPVALAEDSAPTRWIWVPGPQSGDGCEQELRVAHQSFIQRIRELLPVEVLLDGQPIPCQDERCVSARAEAVGAKIGLLAASTCTARALTIDLTVLPLDRASLKYREGMSLTERAPNNERGVRSQRGGAPLSPHLTSAQRVGMKLADSVTLGPPPTPQVKAPSSVKLGIGLLLHHEVAMTPELLGGGGQFELAYAPQASRSVWYSTAGVSAAQSNYFVQRELTITAGGRRRLSEGRLSPTLGGCLELSYERRRERVDQLSELEVRSQYPQQDAQFKLERTSVTSAEGLELRPGLEAGVSWRGRSLELSFVTRISPLTLAPFELQRGAWSTLLGVRW